LITQKTGQKGEDKALSYLTEQGLKLIKRNYSCRLGEIDLVMRDKNYLVFVEVRSRNSMKFGGGIGSITLAKRQKIMKTTSCYLQQYQLLEKNPIRFDVVSIDNNSGSITWLRDAFGYDY